MAEIQVSQGTVVQTVTIASGQTVSGAAKMHDTSLSGLLLPVMTGTSVTFQVSIDGTNFYALHDYTKTAFAVTCDGTARAFYLDPVRFSGFTHIKAVSNGAEGADRTITMISVKVNTKR